MSDKRCSTRYRFIKRLRNSLWHGRSRIGKVMVIADVNDVDRDLGYSLIGFESHFGREINIDFKLYKHPEFKTFNVWIATVQRAVVHSGGNTWSLKEVPKPVVVETVDGHTPDSLQKLLYEVRHTYELETRIASLRIV